MPGPVSYLTLNEKGEIYCEIHSEDAISLDHHSLGTAKATLASSGAQKVSLKSKKAPTGATIIVDYYNFDPSFSYDNFLAAAIAFQSAIDVWATKLSSDTPIYVAAAFQPLGTGVLGSAGATYIFANAPGLERDTWYGNALADKLVGEDLSPGAYDIIARFSTVFPNWYFGTDGNTPATDYDFKSVVMHELGHGLGFFGSMTVNNATGIGSYGYGISDPLIPTIYDRLGYSEDGKSILKEHKYENFTTELGSMLLSGPLTAKGPSLKSATTGAGAKLFTIYDSAIFGDIPGVTDIWRPGSSYSHLDFYTYFGTINGLMVPSLSRGLSYEGPGAITLALFDDLGWNGKVNSEFKEENTNNGNDDEDPTLVDNIVSLYPNPYSSSVNITLKDGRTIKKAFLSDASGYSYSVPNSRINNGETTTIDLSGSTGMSGLYFLQLTYDDNSNEVVKIYKQ
ncbi:hypothetical protein Musp01_21120 [Muricauda sp. NBRC 101325]|nr:hypothetical protein Musp01_21120 [Muricauda sp. NBRC 101325]